MRLILTGGSGSLGTALLKQQDLLKTHGITGIRVISRDEQKQVILQKNYKGDIPLDCYLGDVTDAERIQFALRDAHFVVHAAAQKHIDKFELDVPQGFKVNIVGTQNVAKGFLESKNAVSAIFVSTDKAADPITSYGISKLAAEHAWLWNNTHQKQVKFGVCRYGNIFGSRGSVIEHWTKQAKDGWALSITDTSCTRFFMRISDAARFVLTNLFKNERSVQIPPMKAASMDRVGRTIWYKWREDPPDFKVIGMRSVEKPHEVLEAGGAQSNQVEQLSDEELEEMYREWCLEHENHR